jgi:hypothetical protein
MMVETKRCRHRHRRRREEMATIFGAVYLDEVLVVVLGSNNSDNRVYITYPYKETGYISEVII